jgi:hypothetical protein
MTAARRETRLLELAAKWRADADRSKLLQGLVCADELEAALREDSQRCEGRYPVPHARDEPFEVTYRCALPVGHLGPHRSEPIAHSADDRLGPIDIYQQALRSIAANSCCTSCREAALVAGAALREAAALQLEICPWCNKPVQPGTSAFNRSHWPSCPKDAKGGEALGRVPPAYDLEHEVGRVIEALDLKGATMTVRCAMQEAYQAGVASARQESE